MAELWRGEGKRGFWGQREKERVVYEYWIGNIETWHWRRSFCGAATLWILHICVPKVFSLSLDLYNLICAFLLACEIIRVVSEIIWSATSILVLHCATLCWHLFWVWISLQLCFWFVLNQYRLNLLQHSASEEDVLLIYCLYAGNSPSLFLDWHHYGPRLLAGAMRMVGSNPAAFCITRSHQPPQLV